MTELLITDLGRLKGLKAVIARGSVMRYKNTLKTPGEVARELNVDALISGAVLRSGKHVTITVQVVEPYSGEQLWAKHFECDLGDVVRLQKEVTSAVASEIRVKLTPKERGLLASFHSVNPLAYDAYLMGRHHWYKMTPKGLDTAEDYFQLALQNDPTYGPAFAGNGFVWFTRAHTGLIPPAVGFSKARLAALKAIELDDSLAEAHDLLASIVSFYDWDWTGGEKEFQLAIELNPNYGNAHCFYSFLLHAMQRSREARHQIQRALQIDPYNFFFHLTLGMQLNDENKHDLALLSLRKAENLQPDSLFVHCNLWSLFEQTAQYERAIMEARKYLCLLGAEETATVLTDCNSAQEYRTAMRIAADELSFRSQRTFVSPMNVALLYASAGEDALCLDWLEKSHQEHASRLAYLNVLPVLEPLRSHPRFKHIVRSMNFPS